MPHVSCCSGLMFWQAKKQNLARVRSWCVLSTGCTTRLGSQLWFRNRQKLPALAASTTHVGSRPLHQCPIVVHK